MQGDVSRFLAAMGNRHMSAIALTVPWDAARRAPVAGRTGPDPSPGTAGLFEPNRRDPRFCASRANPATDRFRLLRVRATPGTTGGYHLKK